MPQPIAQAGSKSQRVTTPSHELRDALQTISRLGWRTRRKQGGKVVVYPPNGEKPFTIAATPSDNRAVKNTMALIHRIQREAAV